MRRRAKTQPGERPTVVVLSDPRGLAVYEDDWRDLADNAIEPNPFYEPWMLQPALAHFGAELDLRVALVLSQPKGPPRRGLAPVLIGLFPLHLAGPRRWMPLRRLALWRHEYCFLCAPLVRRGYGRETLAAFFDWFAEQNEAPGPLDLPRLPGDGPLHQLMLEELGRRGWVTQVRDRFTRAVLKHSGTADEYLSRFVSGKRRKELRRQRKRLAELGDVVVAELDARDSAAVEEWIDQFTELEAAGWKGHQQTAFASNRLHAQFFRDIARAAGTQSRLQMTRLTVGGRLIAGKLNLVSGDAGFAFRIAFDESYRRYSPGVLLEIDAIERFCAGDLASIDSCAKRDHPMIDQLWTDRRTVEHLLVSASRVGDLVLSMLPLARFARRAFGSRKT